MEINSEIVLIEWVDSKGLERWEYLDEIEPIEPNRRLSTGFLIEEGEQYKTITQSVSNTQVLSRTTIPCCSIQKIIEVKL